MWWAVTNSACMGHHNRVNEEVNETGGIRWAGRDTMDKTGTHQRPSTDDARWPAIPGNLS